MVLLFICRDCAWPLAYALQDERLTPHLLYSSARTGASLNRVKYGELDK
jgi:hypothetical protein